MYTPRLPLMIWLKRHLEDLPMPEKVVAQHGHFRGKTRWLAVGFTPAVEPVVIEAVDQEDAEDQAAALEAFFDAELVKAGKRRRPAKQPSVHEFLQTPDPVPDPIGTGTTMNPWGRAGCLGWCPYERGWRARRSIEPR